MLAAAQGPAAIVGASSQGIVNLWSVAAKPLTATLGRWVELLIVLCHLGTPVVAYHTLHHVYLALCVPWGSDHIASLRATAMRRCEDIQGQLVLVGPTCASQPK